MARKISFSPNEWYHIYNRGTEKRNIFSSQSDYNRFVSLLYICNGSIPVHLARQGRTLAEIHNIDRGKPLVQIGAYCLMPNHFHLLLCELEQGGVSRFMQKLTTAYTMYFNMRQERTGVLFQGRFKATHADNDQYLKHLISYIHLNPIKLIYPKWKEDGIKDPRRAEKYLQQYRYSSYLDYIGHNRSERTIINKTALPEYFRTPHDIKSLIRDWLNYQIP